MLGNHTVRALIKNGYDVGIIHRASSRLDNLFGLHFSAHLADMEDHVSLRKVLGAVDAVIYCAGFYPRLPRPWQVDVAQAVGSMNTFYRACEGARLERIVYVGAAIAIPRQPDGLPADESLRYPSMPGDKNSYLQCKWAMDELALQKAAEGLPVCTGIPAMTLGEYDYGPSTGGFIVETANQTMPGFVNGKRNVVYAGDAGRGLALVCEKGRIGQRYLITGENIEFERLVEIIARCAGVKAPRAVPLWAARFLGKAQEFLYQTGLGPVPKISQTALAVMASGQYLSASHAEQELGYRPTVSVAEAVSRALRWFRDNGYLSRVQENNR
jgi:dihydroflavonol-4-reductase